MRYFPRAATVPLLHLPYTAAPSPGAIFCCYLRLYRIFIPNFSRKVGCYYFYSYVTLLFLRIMNAPSMTTVSFFTVSHRGSISVSASLCLFSAGVGISSNSFGRCRFAWAISCTSVLIVCTWLILDLMTTRFSTKLV